MENSDLIIGKRYFFDTVKDVSGIYIGISKSGNYQFKDIQGKRDYLEVDGIVRFATKHSFILTPTI